MSNVRQRVVRVIADQLGVEQDTIADTHMSTWYMDSLDEIEIVIALEDEFNFVIPDADAERWTCVADVVAYLDREKS